MVYTIQFINSLKSQYTDKIKELDDFVKMYQTLMAGNETIKNYRYDIVDKGKRIKKGLGNDIDKINKSINAILNKITDKNADILIETLICEINKVYDFNILNILTMGIIDKLVFEKGYQDTYINLCNRLWSLKKWQEKLVSIFIDERDQYFWYLNQQASANLSLDTQMNGPFNSERDAYQSAWKLHNFKRTFLNELQRRFNERTKYIDLCKEETDDELRFKYRRHIFGIIEAVGKLYNKKYLSESVIHSVLMKLIHYEEKEKEIAEKEITGLIEEDLEGFCILWNIIDDNNLRPFDDKLVKQYFEHIETTVMKGNWIMRLKFMLDDMVDKYRKKYVSLNTNATAAGVAGTNVGDGKYVLRRNRPKLDEILDIYIAKNNLIETINKIKMLPNINRDTFMDRIVAKNIDKEIANKLLIGLDWKSD